jgi:hypothetical protein
MRETNATSTTSTEMASHKFGKRKTRLTCFITVLMLRRRYSSEITGTIIVQCIPILRPILREFTTTLTSRRLQSTDYRGSTFTGKHSSKRGSGGPPYEEGSFKHNDRIALEDITEEEIESWKRPMSASTEQTYLDLDQKMRMSTPSSPMDHNWTTAMSSPRTLTSHQSTASTELTRDPMSRSFISMDADVEDQKGLYPPPRRIP